MAFNVINNSDVDMTGIFLFTKFGQSYAQQFKNTIHCIAIQASESCNFGRFHIDRKQANESSKLSFCYFSKKIN